MRTSSERGAALIEAMIGLSILLVGLLAMMNLQIYGINSNQGARATARATEIANDLVAALERATWTTTTTDPILTSTFGPSATPPAISDNFGALINKLPIASPTVHDWTELNAGLGLKIGAIPNGSIPVDPLVAGQPLFQRRWTVWDYSSTGAAPIGSKVIAVSVIYHEGRSAAPREVVVYSQLVNMGILLANLNSNL